MSTNPPKLKELQLEYEQQPSLLKGDSPGKEWLDIPVEFRDGNCTASGHTPFHEGSSGCCQKPGHPQPSPG